jgi:hypothetical protein
MMRYLNRSLLLAALISTGISAYAGHINNSQDPASGTYYAIGAPAVMSYDLQSSDCQATMHRETYPDGDRVTVTCAPNYTSGNITFNIAYGNDHNNQCKLNITYHSTGAPSVNSVHCMGDYHFSGLALGPNPKPGNYVGLKFSH